jgi:putative FmdB family regulatory protein
MPIYEYVPLSGDCDQCGGVFSDLQKISDPHHANCPDCGQACRRILSLFAIGTKAASPSRPENAKTTSPAKEEKKNPHQGHNCKALGCFKRAEKLLKEAK